MLTFRSSILLQGPANTPELETLVVLVSFIANMTTLFAIAAFMERDPHTFDRLPGWLFCALIMPASWSSTSPDAWETTRR